MNLYDHPGPSGVPLGGIGTGYFGISPEGAIDRVALNDTFTPHYIKDVKGSFFAVHERIGERDLTSTYRMVRDDKQYGSMEGCEHTYYRGLYPFAGISFESKKMTHKTEVSLQAFSPIIAHNIKDSSLPVVFFEVHLQSSDHTEKDVSVAFSWEDILGRQVFDIKDEASFEQARSETYWDLQGGLFGYRDRIPTFAKSWENNDLKALRYSSRRI